MLHKYNTLFKHDTIHTVAIRRIVTSGVGGCLAGRTCCTVVTPSIGLKCESINRYCSYQTVATKINSNKGS